MDKYDFETFKKQIKEHLDNESLFQYLIEALTQTQAREIREVILFHPNAKKVLEINLEELQKKMTKDRREIDLNKPAFRAMPEKAELIKSGKCPICQKQVSVSDFKDELSRKEFKISGLCQKCQDKVWVK